MNIYDTWLNSRLVHFLRNDPVTQSLLTILSDPLQDTWDVCEWLLAHDSIDTAEGEQLELLGSLIGVARPPAQELDINLFTLCRLGETDDLDGRTGFFNDDDTVELGGYMTTTEGLVSQTEPGADMSDADYRYLILQKAALYRTKMTRENLFNYLIAFGAKCLIDDDTKFVVEIDPFSYYDLNEWEKDYMLTRGFKPASILTQFRDNMRHKDSI